MKSENKTTILIEAASFEELGGWVIDQQSMDFMGSSYLLAHGMGKPVKNARTKIYFQHTGEFNVWVRTRDWASPWKKDNDLYEPPGKFKLLINNQAVETIFGTVGSKWHWQYGGKINITQNDNKLELHDLTGFEGRCDAILFSNEPELIPPDEGPELASFRNHLAGFSNEPENDGNFDLIVAGGGMAGICASVTAARRGLKVAMIQDRPVIGGNNSSEVRVGLSGLIFKGPYPNLGKLVDEIGSVGHWTLWEAERDPESERSKRILEIIKNNPEKKIHNAGPKSNYGDDKKLRIVEEEENIKLFLNTRIARVEMSGNKIISVTGKSIVTGQETKFRGALFADCTGDGSLGILAGADFRMGRESKAETGEDHAPPESDELVMGTSVQWYADNLDKPGTFPDCPWAIQFTEETCQKLTRGDWNWETGFNYNQIEDVERIRDYAFRAVYGNWSFLKNQSKDKETYTNNELRWVAYIGGKRESRRLMGDVVLREQDILNRVPYPDASFATTWTIDLHYPVEIEGLNEEPLLSRAEMTEIEPYAVPYRCLYSRNIDNLFMAGRNISVTHVALGTVRVMRTAGMMGEVVGMAASVAIRHNTNPRGVYKDHLDGLIELMKQGVSHKKFAH